MRFLRTSTGMLGVVAVLAVLPAAAHAQRVGFLAGATFSSVRTTSDLALSNRTGTMFGVTLQLPLSAGLIFEPELQVLQKGAKFRVGANAGGFKLNYFEIPLLLRHDYSRGTITPHIYAGPTIGINAGCDVNSTNNPGTAGVFSDCDGTNFKPKTLDYGLTLGGGVDFNLGGLAATGGARYGIGLANIRSDNSQTFKNRVHNGVLSLYVGLLFGKLSKAQ